MCEVTTGTINITSVDVLSPTFVFVSWYIELSKDYIEEATELTAKIYMLDIVSRQSSHRGPNVETLIGDTEVGIGNYTFGPLQDGTDRTISVMAKFLDGGGLLKFVEPTKTTLSLPG